MAETQNMLPSKAGLPGSDPVSQSQQSLVLEFYHTNQFVGSKFDSSDLALLLIGSACSKHLTFAARGTSKASTCSQFSQHGRCKAESSEPYLGHPGYPFCFYMCSFAVYNWLQL